MLLNETNWLLYNFKEKPKINENLITTKLDIINPSIKANLPETLTHLTTQQLHNTHKFKTTTSSINLESKIIHSNRKISPKTTRIPVKLNSTTSLKSTLVASSKIFSTLGISNLSSLVKNNQYEARPCICATNNPNATAFNLVANHHQNSHRFGNGEEFTNIWKLAFFVLAFLMCFISLILILTFSIKIVM
jgi:hypothetical protein